MIIDTTAVISILQATGYSPSAW